MFGIGLPELIVILGLALIVVGPDKLPDLARSIAKGVLELKKTAESLKEELTQEGGMLEELRPEIDAVKTLKSELAKTTNLDWHNDDKPINPSYSVKDVPDTSKEPLNDTAEAEASPVPHEVVENSDGSKNSTGENHPPNPPEEVKKADDAGKKS